MQQPKFRIQNSEFRIRPAFTLTELMIVISIMAILAGLGFSAFSGAMNLSRQQRTGAIINKIDQLIGERWEGYRTRAVPIKIPSGIYLHGRTQAQLRLNALRDLMRMELPDRVSDVIDGPCDCCPSYYDVKNPTVYADTSIFINSRSRPSLQSSYLRRAYVATSTSTLAALSSVWTTENQGSECLYLILSMMRDGDKKALDYFDTTEIGDTDNDGMPEILDGWGTPITFIRWPAGYAEQTGPDGAWGVAGVDDDGDGLADNPTEAGWPGSDDSLPIPGTLVGPVPTMQTRSFIRAPDPFDPTKVTAGSAAVFASGPATLFGGIQFPAYALYPLIVSAGFNKSLDIVTDYPPTATPFRYSPDPFPPNVNNNNNPNPYILISVPLGSAGAMTMVNIGTPADVDGDGLPGYTDNISNHSLRSQQP